MGANSRGSILSKYSGIVAYHYPNADYKQNQVPIMPQKRPTGIPLVNIGATVNVTLEMAYLLGLLLADGGIYRYRDSRGPNSYRYQVDFVADRSEAFAKQVAGSVYEQFGLKPCIRKHPKADCFYVTASNKEIWKKLSEIIPNGNKTLSAELPTKDPFNIVDHKISLLRGLFDGEGCITF